MDYLDYTETQMSNNLTDAELEEIRRRVNRCIDCMRKGRARRRMVDWLQKRMN